MRNTTLTILILSLHLFVCGQDRLMELDFEKRKQDIKQSRIKIINEYQSQRFSKCSGEKHLVKQYKFDKKGNLKTVSFFGNIGSFPYKVINYNYNTNGEYIKKAYIYYDTLGKVNQKKNWNFKFDNNGKRLNEFLLSGSADTILTNTLDYDQAGNLSSVIRDGVYKWSFTYNINGQKLERREWAYNSDSLICVKVISYNYNDNQLLISEIESNPSDTSDILNEQHYMYTNGKLTFMNEIKTVWISSKNEPNETKYWNYNYIYEYDNNLNLIVKSKFYHQSQEPKSCLYYQYEYY